MKTNAGIPCWNPNLIAMLIASLFVVFSSSVRAQSLAEERALILKSIGQTKELDLNLFPLAQSTGLVFSQDIVEPPGVTLNMRVHFLVQQRGESWTVEVMDRAGDVKWSITDLETTGDDFWSDEIQGEKVTIRVLSSISSNPLQLIVDKIAIGMLTQTPVSITGENQLSSIVGQDDWIVELGRAVARLRFVSDDGYVYVCTAFLVTQDIMITNQHCIATSAEMESALVDFDYDGPGLPGKTLHLTQLLDTDVALDYSVIRLSEPAARVPLQLDVVRPEENQQLLIIQHPAGEPKQISLQDCKVDGPEVKGRIGTATDFGHQCDTMGGSSGSPVFHFGNRNVVGLHHLGITPGSHNLFNRAVHIALVLDDMNPEVRAEIEDGQHNQ